MAKVQVLKNQNSPKGKMLKKKNKILNKTIGKKSKLEKKTSWRNSDKSEKGVVYLSHIPHGFYEDQIEEYFKQFGKVTGVSVPRSKTGRMRGYAFIEFQHPEVAQIAADSMNNYLMFNRLLKAKYIPPNEQKPKYFLAAKAARLNHTTAVEKAEIEVNHNRKLKNRKLKIGLEAKQAVKLAHKTKILKGKLEKLGVDYDFEVQEGNIESIFEKKKQLEAEKKKSSENITSNDIVSEEDEVSSMENEGTTSIEELSNLELEEGQSNKSGKSKNSRLKKYKGLQTQSLKGQFKQKKRINKSTVNNVKDDTVLMNKKRLAKSSGNKRKTSKKEIVIQNGTVINKSKLTNHTIATKDKSTQNIVCNNSPKILEKGKRAGKLISMPRGNEVPKRKVLVNTLKQQISKAENPEKNINTKIRARKNLKNSRSEKNESKKLSAKLTHTPNPLATKRNSSEIEKIIKTPHPKKAKINVGNVSPKQKAPILDKSPKAHLLPVSPLRKKPRHRVLKKTTP